MKHLSSLFIVTALFAPLFAQASPLVIAEESVVLSENVSDDAYVIAGDSDVRSEVIGDLHSVGGQVRIESNVSEDLHVAGGKVVVTGSVGDDARIAGGEVRISSQITDDLFLVAGEAEVQTESFVGGDVYLAGGDIRIDGSVSGNAVIRAANVTLNGDINGTADIVAESIVLNGKIYGESTLNADRIVLHESAEFFSDVRYYSSNQVNFNPYLNGAVAQKDDSMAPTIRTHDKKQKSHVMGVIAKVFFSTVFASLVLAMLAVFDKKFFTSVSKKMTKEFWPSFFLGLAYFFVTPVFAFVLMFTIIGIPFSLLILFSYAFSLYFALSFTAYALSKHFVILKKKKWKQWQVFLFSVGMFAVLKSVGMIPFFGWLLSALCVIVCYGAILSEKFRLLRKLR